MTLAFELPNKIVRLSEELFFTTIDDDYPSGSEIATFQINIKEQLESVSVYLIERESDEGITRLAVFHIDYILEYVPFARDHGPLNIGMVSRFAELLEAMRRDEKLAGVQLCLVTLNEPDTKSNAACLAAVYTLLTTKCEPYIIMKKFATMELKPFRDAGQGGSEWSMSLQDVLYGAYKGMQCGMVDFSALDASEYEFYERVDHGDFNTIGPFVPFATPREEAKSIRLMRPVTRLVLEWFSNNHVKAVVRLNEACYHSSIFTSRGIAHLDMEFPDGSSPPLELVRKFIAYADRVIEEGGKVAVHCKAGLGRTGVMIGAYLIYKHGFAANEAIGLMRLIRPGMVVGPQQVWLVENAATFIRWSAVDDFKAAQSVLRDMVSVPQSPPKHQRILAIARTPAQPRKTPGKGGSYTTEVIEPVPFPSLIRKGSPVAASPSPKRFRSGIPRPALSPMRQIGHFMGAVKPSLIVSEEKRR